MSKVLGNRIRRARVREGLTQAELAEKVGVVAGAVAHWEEWPQCAGVYVLYDSSQRPVYVGKAEKISSRLAGHQMSFWYKDPIVRYGSYIEVADKQLRSQLEQTMIKFLKSNAVINKQFSEGFED